MTNTAAEEFKNRGNEAFAAKRFEDAIVMYDKAIETNPTNFVYFNNRAAANHELKRYDQAIDDARKSIEIQDNAKAHTRIGVALWAQGKLRDAKAEFETAASLDPSNASVRGNVEKLEQLLNPPRANHPHAYTAPPPGSVPTPTLLGGEFTSAETGPAGIFLDAAVVGLTAFLLFGSFLVPRLGRQCWLAILVASMAQQLLVIKAKNLLHFNMEGMRQWGDHYCTLCFALCGLALISGTGSQPLIASFMAMYSVVDLANRKSDLVRNLGPAGGFVAPYLQKAVEQKTMLLLLAATVEALLLFLVMFTGGTIFTLVYIQYVKNRFRCDGYVRLAFTGLRMNLSRVTRSSYMPAFVDHYTQKFCDLLFKLSQQAV